MQVDRTVLIIMMRDGSSTRIVTYMSHRKSRVYVVSQSTFFILVKCRVKKSSGESQKADGGWEGIYNNVCVW